MFNLGFDPLSPEVGTALHFILKNWNHEKETLKEFKDRLDKGHFQPERSKREDSEYGAKCDFGILKSEMRCSEHCGNTVRDK